MEQAIINWEKDKVLIEDLKEMYGVENAYECCGEVSCVCGKKVYTGYLMPRWEFFYRKGKTVKGKL